jgi:hypothetical protein
MSFIISISVGYLKIYQIQEKMETTIRLQQEWTVFGSKITSEMQLPENLRKDALFLIIRMKETYFELIKSQVEISKKIMRRVAWRNGLNIGDLTLSEIFERVIKGEAMRLGAIVKADFEANRENYENDTKINVYDGDTSEEDEPKEEHISRLQRVGSELKPKYLPEKLLEIKEKLKHVESKPRKVTLTNRGKLTSYLMKPVTPTLGNSSSSSSTTAGTGLVSYSSDRRSSTTSSKSKSPVVPAIPVSSDEESNDEHLSTIVED